MTRCVRCSRPAIYIRSYSGERLCRNCFIKSIDKKVQRTISRYGMFKPDDTIAVAVSGGKDSLSLLHMLEKIESMFPKSKLIAVTVDEGITGYRIEAVRLAKDLCMRLGIEHHIISFTEAYGHELDAIVEMAIKRKTSLSPCSYCGMLRSRALDIFAREMKADKLATAHNLDDEAQTMLLNIIHGDALRIARVGPILNGYAPFFVQRVKPLRDILEREISMYAFLNNITFQTTPCPYAGTAMRNDLRNFLNRLETKYPGTMFTIHGAFNKISSVMKTVLSPVELKKCSLCGEATIGEICRLCQTMIELGVR